MTTKIPAHIVGADAVEALHAAGYRVVPAKPSLLMCEAAAEAMVKRRKEMGATWFFCTNKQKAAIRYGAMLDVYMRDREGLRSRKPPVVPEEPKMRWWRVKLGKFFDFSLGWQCDIKDEIGSNL